MLSWACRARIRPRIGTYVAGRGCPHRDGRLFGRHEFQRQRLGRTASPVTVTAPFRAPTIAGPTTTAKTRQSRAWSITPAAGDIDGRHTSRSRASPAERCITAAAITDHQRPVHHRGQRRGRIGVHSHDQFRGQRRLHRQEVDDATAAAAWSARRPRTRSRSAALGRRSVEPITTWPASRPTARPSAAGSGRQGDAAVGNRGRHAASTGTESPSPSARPTSTTSSKAGTDDRPAGRAITSSMSCWPSPPTATRPTRRSSSITPTAPRRPSPQSISDWAIAAGLCGRVGRADDRLSQHSSGGRQTTARLTFTVTRLPSIRRKTVESITLPDNGNVKILSMATQAHAQRSDQPGGHGRGRAASSTLPGPPRTAPSPATTSIATRSAMPRRRR